MTSRGTAPLLSVRGLSESFKSGSRLIPALRGVSFDVMKSEIFGLVGESGSGKTTTGRIISGIYEPTDGRVSYLGEIIRMGDEEARRRIREAKGRARGDISSLVFEMIKHPTRLDEISEDIENVNEDLQNTLKSEREVLRLAASVRKKWGKRPHPDIRMVFQDPSASLNPRMTVGESVGEALFAIGVRDRDEIEARVIESLSHVGLAPSTLSRYPHEFSGGQRQRVGIARAIVTRPRLLIADEPISALDVSVGAQVVNLIRTLAGEMSLSVLFIAHDLSVVRHICDSVGVMQGGRMLEIAPSEELFENPRHPYTRALLSAVPAPDPRAAKSQSRLPYDGGGPRGELVDIGGGHLVAGEE